MVTRIEYSDKYMDDSNEYRHVMLPKELAKSLPKSRLLTESEWRSIGVSFPLYSIYSILSTLFYFIVSILSYFEMKVQQSRGWQHYAIHRPEPHILLFRRPLGIYQYLYTYLYFISI